MTGERVREGWRTTWGWDEEEARGLARCPGLEGRRDEHNDPEGRWTTGFGEGWKEVTD